MSIAQSKLTAQRQTLVPAEIRKKLGLRSGSVLEWTEKDGQIVVSRAGRYTSAEVHEALFGVASTQKPRADVKEGIKKYIRRRHARD